MSKTSHTPGPWKAFIVGKVVEVQAQKGKPHIVGWTGFDESDVPLAVHKANARLIAAAPDLLVALTEILARLDRALPPLNGKDADLRAYARAAIAAATGSPTPHPYPRRRPNEA